MFVALAAVTLLAGSASHAPDTTALGRIERAYAEGRIDAPSRALLGLALLRAPASLPEEFRPAPGEEAPRCGTLLARRAWLENELGSFSDEQAELYSFGVARPNLDSNIAVFDSSGSLIIATLHYASGTTSGPEADAAAAFITQSWTTQVDTMGWRAPPPDAGVGSAADPDVEIDIYLDPAQNAGATVPEGVGPEAWDDAPSFIVLDPASTNIEAFLAHELNHVLQYGYDVYEGDMFYEATAVWMEDQVFDSVDEYTFYLADFQTEPQRTLSFATYDGFYMYGATIFVHFLATLGSSTVEDVWEASKQNDGVANSVDFYDGVEAVSPDDFEQLYAQFAGVRFLTGARAEGTLDEGANMDAVEVLATYTLDSLENGTSANPPMGLGANYLVVDTTGAEPDDTITLTVNGDDDGPWAITVVSRPASGEADIDVVRGTDGSVEATVNGLDQLSAVAFAVTHLAGVDAGPDLASGPGGHTADLTTHGFSYTFVKEKEAAGCGCRIPTRTHPADAASIAGALAIAAAAVVLRRRAG